MQNPTDHEEDQMDLISDLILMQELAEHGSFSKVGRRRGQAPSSIARRIDGLEVHLKARLFNRAPSGLSLTAFGSQKLIEARSVIEAADKLTSRDGENGVLTGHIVVSAPSRLGETLVTPVVAQFLKTHPDASADLHFTDSIQNLEQDKVDLSVRVGTQSPDHHYIRRIVANKRILVASQTYLASRAPIKSVTDLDEHDGLLLGRTSTWSLIHQDGTPHVVFPKQRLRAITGDVLLSMCKANLGIALKSTWDVRRDLENGKVVRVLPKWHQAHSSDIMLVTPSKKLVSPTAIAFNHMLTDYLKSVLGHDDQ